MGRTVEYTYVSKAVDACKSVSSGPATPTVVGSNEVSRTACTSPRCYWIYVLRTVTFYKTVELRVTFTEFDVMMLLICLSIVSWKS